jgi:hypothetical protein
MREQFPRQSDKRIKGGLVFAGEEHSQIRSWRPLGFRRYRIDPNMNQEQCYFKLIFRWCLSLKTSVSFGAPSAMSAGKGVNMRPFETMGRVTTDRALIDLRDARDDLSIKISILEDADRIDPAVMSTLKRNLGILDHRIAQHRKPIDA